MACCSVGETERGTSSPPPPCPSTRAHSFPLSLPARPSNINSASFSLGQYSAVDTSGGKSRLQPYVKVIRTVQCCHSPSCHSWKTVRFEGIRFLFVSPELALIPRFGGLFAVPTSIIFVTFSEPVSLNLGIGSLRQAVNHSEKPSLHRITLWITCFLQYLFDFLYSNFPRHTACTFLLIVHY